MTSQQKVNKLIQDNIIKVADSKLGDDLIEIRHIKSNMVLEVTSESKEFALENAIRNVEIYDCYADIRSDFVQMHRN